MNKIAEIITASVGIFFHMLTVILYFMDRHEYINFTGFVGASSFIIWAFVADRKNYDGWSKFLHWSIFGLSVIQFGIIAIVVIA